MDPLGTPTYSYLTIPTLIWNPHQQWPYLIRSILPGGGLLNVSIKGVSEAEVNRRLSHDGVGPVHTERRLKQFVVFFLA